MELKNIDQIYWDAAQIATDADRDAYLTTACGSDAELRRRVEQLLDARPMADAVFETPLSRQLTCLLQSARPDETEICLDFLSPSERPDALGRLGHFEVLEVVGRGGMGVVLRALDEKLHRVTAIKVMAAQLANNATARQRLIREAHAAAAVCHDHIVTLYAVEEANGLPYLVMQYVSGLSLQQRLDRDGPLELAEIVRIGMQTAAGLAAAHAQGVIHRDIKPSNILLENGVERVKITDFGLARAADDVGITRTGEVTGTPQYMSPEQAQGHPVDARSDLFSLGCVLYAMCTGRSPFRAETTVACLRRVCDDTPRPIREINPDIPNWLVAIIDRLLEKDREHRFQTSKEVAELLENHLAHLQDPHTLPFPGVIKPIKRPRKSNGLTRWLATGAVLACLAVMLGVTEATGVTNLSTTVLKIVTGEGTLVIEVDDPEVKVTIEGDGGLIISGAGAHEVRLRPGNYKVRAAKDGKLVLLDQDLVTITRDGKQLVRVRHESPREERRAENDASSSEVWRRSLPKDVKDIAFANDGRSVAGASHLVFTFDPESGQMLERLEGHTSAVRNVAISPDGRWVVSGAEDSTVRMWNLETGKEHRRFKTNVGEAATATTKGFSFFAFSPDGSRLIASGRNDLVMWDVESDAPPRQFVGHTESPRRVAFSPDGTLIASCGHDGTARLWRVDTGTILHTLRDGANWILSVEFSPDGASLATAGRQITLWNVATGKEQWHYAIGDRWVEATPFTSDGKYLVAGLGKQKSSSEGNLVILDALTGRELQRFGGPTEYVFDVTLSPDGRDVLVGESQGMHRYRLPERFLPQEAATLQPSTPSPAVAPFDAAEAKQLQEVWAKHLGVPVEFTNTVGMKFRLIPPGEFEMGCAPPAIEAARAASRYSDDQALSNALSSEGPIHRVILTEPFYIAVTEVTQGEFETVTGHNPSTFRAGGANADHVRDIDTSRLPAQELSWNDAADFCSRLSTREGLKPNYRLVGSGVQMLPGNGYRLVREAQWEFACRAGTTTPFWYGEEAADPADREWLRANSAGRPHPVGSLASNPFGLFDMHGNVSEWCQDGWNPEFYSSFMDRPAVDPLSKPQGRHEHMVRGGAWTTEPSVSARSASRRPAVPSKRHESIGFRVTLHLDSARQVIERQKSSGTTSAPAEKGAFVLLGGQKVAERKFDTLGEAVQSASDGDTVEIRGNGPYVIDAVTVADQRSLRIQAGHGARPVLILKTSSGEESRHLISTNGPLVLEGLELRCDRQAAASSTPGFVAIYAPSGPLFVANCRIIAPFRAAHFAGSSRQVVLKNCEFLSTKWSDSVVGPSAAKGVWEVDNCVQIGGCMIVCGAPSPTVHDTKIRISRCSLVRCTPVIVCFHTTPRDPLTGQPSELVQFEVSQCLTDAGQLLKGCRLSTFADRGNPLHGATADEVLLRLVRWRGSRNVHRRLGHAAAGPEDAMLSWEPPTESPPLSTVSNLAAWRAFWDSPEAGSIQGEIRYRGGDLAARMASGGPEAISPNHFRLLEGSAGYRAGPDGKDLGADVDLVGPGAAYERWKKMEGYQQWLKEIGQLE